MTIGENMYRIGQKLGYDEKLVKDIVDYYYEGRIIEFPVLGPYINLVYDWYKVLVEKDRNLLREGFLLKIEELLREKPYQEITAEHIFNLMGYHAFADRLIPMKVESLVVDGFIKKINGNVAITENGLHKSNEIKDRNRRVREETLKRLGLFE
jgi:hypothetical protein